MYLKHGVGRGVGVLHCMYINVVVCFICIFKKMGGGACFNYVSKTTGAGRIFKFGSLP